MVKQLEKKYFTMKHMQKKKSSSNNEPLLKFALACFYFLGLVAGILVFAFFFLTKMSFGFMSLQPFWLYPAMILVLSGMGVIASALMKLTKQFGAKKTTLTKEMKTHFMAAGVISCILLGFMTYTICALVDEKPPKFFPFDDPQATYRVTKHGDNYMLRYQSTGDMNTRDVCDTHNGKTSCSTEVANDLETMIGNSDIELEPLLGKPVVVDGEFVYDDEQCIAGMCHHIGGWAVLNLTNISVITE